MKPIQPEEKLQFLYAELAKLEEIYSPLQRQYLLEEIDYQELQLLKTKTHNHFKHIENEAN